MRRTSDTAETVAGDIYLGMGSNLGNREALIAQGLKNLIDRGVSLLSISSLYETDPVGMADQGKFLNLAVQGDWAGDPRALLEVCLGIETELGRVRRLRNGPRTLDIDILLFGNRICREAGLEIPHPRLHERRFVLIPLAEIAPGAVHPIFGRTIEALLAVCPDLSGIRKWPRRLSLEPPDPSGYNPAASRG